MHLAKLFSFALHRNLEPFTAEHAETAESKKQKACELLASDS